MSSLARPESTDAEPTDRVAQLSTGVVGGPLGRYAAEGVSVSQRLVLTGVLCLGSCVTMALAFLQKSYCVRFGWGVPQVYWKGCYSDLPSFVVDDGLMRGLPYDAGSALPQPVGTGILLRLLAALTPGEGFARQQGFFAAWTLTSAVLLLVTVLATMWTCRRHPQWAMHVAFAPVLVTAGLVGTDLLGVALTAVAVWLWSRRNLTAAGLLFGLAMASRTYPILVLAVIGILTVRAGVVRDWARTAGVALLTAAAVVGGVSLAYGTGTLTAYGTWARAGSSYGSPWFLATLWERPIDPLVLTVLAMLGWILALGVGGLMALTAAVRPRIGEIAVVVVVLVLLTGKALPPQSSLWLIPLVAIAGLPWRAHLVWAATEVVYFVAVWLYLGGLAVIDASLPKGWYALFLMIRLAGLAQLALVAAHRALSRSPAEPAPGREDVVRAGGVDDAAGPMSGRSDAVVVRYER